MKHCIAFDIDQETTVEAIKILILPADPTEQQGFDEEAELDMGVNLRLVPGREYAVALGQESEDLVDIWLSETLVIPRFPRKQVKLLGASGE